MRKGLGTGIIYTTECARLRQRRYACKAVSTPLQLPPLASRRLLEGAVNAGIVMKNQQTKPCKDEIALDTNQAVRPLNEAQ